MSTVAASPRSRRSGSCPASPGSRSTTPTSATTASPAPRTCCATPTREFLHFTTDFRVAFSNNCAEQAIRMIRIKTKVSGGFRTLTGAQTFLAIRGYISHLRKNRLRAADALRNALLGNPWMPPGYAAT